MRKIELLSKEELFMETFETDRESEFLQNEIAITLKYGTGEYSKTVREHCTNILEICLDRLRKCKQEIGLRSLTAEYESYKAERQGSIRKESRS